MDPAYTQTIPSSLFIKYFLNSRVKLTLNYAVKRQKHKWTKTNITHSKRSNWFYMKKPKGSRILILCSNHVKLLRI